MKTLLTVLFLFILSNVYSKVWIKKDTLFVTVQNGIMQDKVLKFKYDKETIKEIKTTSEYRTYVSEYDPKEYPKDNDTTKHFFETYFMRYRMSIVTNGIEKRESIDYPKDTYSMFYIEDNHLQFRYPINIENEYGNKVTKYIFFDGKKPMIE
jgi:hypothetical protein